MSSKTANGIEIVIEDTLKGFLDYRSPRKNFATDTDSSGEVTSVSGTSSTTDSTGPNPHKTLGRSLRMFVPNNIRELYLKALNHDAHAHQLLVNLIRNDRINPTRLAALVRDSANDANLGKQLAKDLLGEIARYLPGHRYREMSDNVMAVCEKNNKFQALSIWRDPKPDPNNLELEDDNKNRPRPGKRSPG